LCRSAHIVCPRVSAALQLHAALVSSAKVMRCIQCSLVVVVAAAAAATTTTSTTTTTTILASNTLDHRINMQRPNALKARTVVVVACSHALFAQGCHVTVQGWDSILRTFNHKPNMQTTNL